MHVNIEIGGYGGDPLTIPFFEMGVFHADTGIDVRAHLPMSHDLLSREQHILLPTPMHITHDAV